MRAFSMIATIAMTSSSVALAPSVAEAMCGCMIRRPPPRPTSESGGQETLLVADASVVVLMREGRRTVLTMRNDYQGPPEDFALVVPVPEVLEQNAVRTLPHGLVEKLDRLSAPRLAEYWEQDPCGSGSLADRRGRQPRPAARAAGSGVGGLDSAEAAPPPPPVIVEREFSVDEYDIQILSANDSSGLERWLNDNGYQIPSGASAVFRPYVEAGTKFFVAKVDASKVRFEGGRARLSPLQFHYDSDAFQLPIRLGLLNSPGEQDLVVMVLGRGQRYQVANHGNAVIPTNLEVAESVRDDFAGFYEALFRRVAANNPRAVITEYASRLNPGEMRERDLRRLGADVVPSQNPNGLTLTRLHYRYTAQTIGDDLVFQVAPAIGGGDGLPGSDGALGDVAPVSRPVNSFRGRFGIVHRWTRGTSCANPIRGRWRRPSGEERRRFATSELGAPSAIDDGRLASLVVGDGLQRASLTSTPPPAQDPAVTQMVQDDKDRLALMGMVGDTPSVPPAPTPTPPAASDDGGCSSSGSNGGDALPLLGLLALALLIRGRRRRA